MKGHGHANPFGGRIIITFPPKLLTSLLYPSQHLFAGFLQEAKMVISTWHRLSLQNSEAMGEPSLWLTDNLRWPAARWANLSAQLPVKRRADWCASSGCWGTARDTKIQSEKLCGKLATTKSGAFNPNGIPPSGIVSSFLFLFVTVAEYFAVISLLLCAKCQRFSMYCRRSARDTGMIFLTWQVATFLFRFSHIVSYLYNIWSFKENKEKLEKVFKPWLNFNKQYA